MLIPVDAKRCAVQPVISTQMQCARPQNTGKSATQAQFAILEKKPAVTLSHEVECDEAYVIAGHKGQPEVVKSKERKGRRRRLKGKAGRGT